MLLESSVMTIQTVAHFSIKFHPHPCVTLVPDEQERGSGGVLHTQGHVDTQKYRYCQSLVKLFSACSSPRAELAAKQVTNIVHKNTRIFWNFSGEMFITHIFNYAFGYVSEINPVTVMISVLTMGKLRLADLICPQPPFCDCWDWALRPPPLTQPPHCSFPGHNCHISNDEKILFDWKAALSAQLAGYISPAGTWGLRRHSISWFI